MIEREIKKFFNHFVHGVLTLMGRRVIIARWFDSITPNRSQRVVWSRYINESTANMQQVIKHVG